MTLLDFGAGGGGFLRHARGRGWRVLGFEPGKRGRDNCVAAGLEVTDSLDSLPDSHFQLITLHHVFEHLTDPVGVLGSLKRLLAPTGRLFIEVPNVNSLRARLALPILSQRFGFDERYRAFPIHLAYYSESTLGLVLARAGWVVRDSFTVGMGLDECFRSSLHEPPQPVAQAVTQAGKLRRLRHLARDGFLALGLGENLATVAQPSD